MRKEGFRGQDRRGVNRPRNGDEKPCARCGARAEFSERNRAEGRVVPAWVCNAAKCDYHEPVRVQDAR
jgi:hypothetical protein